MNDEWMQRIGYDEFEEPLVRLVDFSGNFIAYCLPENADKICERYNRGFPEPPNEGLDAEFLAQQDRDEQSPI